MNPWYRRRWWPIPFSLITIAAATYYAITCTPHEAADVGNFVAGFAGALAFIWLVAGYQQQGEELKLQREELQSQRTALSLQSETAALGQIAILLEDFRQRLPAHDESIQTFENLGNRLLHETQNFQIIRQSSDNAEITNHWYLWTNYEGLARRFLIAVRVCAKLYARATGNVTLTDPPTMEQFILENGAAIGSIPHLNEAYGAAHAVAKILVGFAPLIESARTKAEASTNALVPGMTTGDPIDNAIKVRVRHIEEGVLEIRPFPWKGIRHEVDDP